MPNWPGYAAPGGLTIQRDLFFKPNKTLQAYADEAHRRGSIDA
ncbi:DUF2958 domain-containing protein [Bradyrhizobium sp. STM 3566]